MIISDANTNESPGLTSAIRAGCRRVGCASVIIVVLKHTASPLTPVSSPRMATFVSTGVKGVQLLLDGRKLRPGVDFDAIVTPSDLLAPGALDELQKRYRILRAKELLRCTSDDVKNIALRVGFVTPAYFSRVFRKVTGASPSAYREHRE